MILVHYQGTKVVLRSRPLAVIQGKLGALREGKLHSTIRITILRSTDHQVEQSSNVQF